MPDIDHDEEQRVFVNGRGRFGKHENHLREESIEPRVVISPDNILDHLECLDGLGELCPLK